MFACLSNLKQSCRELYVEQKFFYGHLMKMCRTCSKLDYNTKVTPYSRDKIFLSANSEKQFHELDFDMILLSILCELDFGL